MPTTEKNQVMVELYDLSITERKDDRFGRVVTSKSLNEDDLIKIVASRRTDISPTTIKAALDLVKQAAIDEICNGASVHFGLAHLSLKVNGVFMGDNANWDSSKHSLAVSISPNARLRQAVQATGVNVRGLAVTGTIINQVTDVSSGEVNGQITPGGGVNVQGSRIRVEGDKPGVGLKLINTETEAETEIPATSILVNDPSKLTFIIPATLAKGDYQLSVTTQFSSSGIKLKEPRTYTFEYVLTVI